jgi:hypothetical protein
MRRQTRRFLFAAALGGLAALAGARGARAGFTVTLDSTAPDGGSNTVFNYSASIPVGDQINPGDFFRIYDFAGLVGSPVSPAGWTATVANSNPTPPPNVILTHGDDPTIPNITWTYNPGGAPILGAATVTGFSATSTLTFLGAIKDFVGRDTKSTGPTAGSPVDSIGDVRVPGVPEPSSLLSASFGALALGTLIALRHRRAAGRASA